MTLHGPPPLEGAVLGTGPAGRCGLDPTTAAAAGDERGGDGPGLSLGVLPELPT